MKNHDYCPDSDEAAQLRKEKDDLAFELGQADAQLAAIRTRVAELDERANRYEGWLREVAVQRDELKQRNAELEAALQAAENYLRPYAEIHDLPEARRIAERIAHILARAESVTPAKHCEDCAPEFGCWDGGEPCYKQPLVKSTPVKHPDTARLNWLEANRAQVNYTTGAEPHLAHVSTPKTYGESCETIRARNAELESAADKEEQHRKGNVRLMARVHDLGQRNAELEAALQAAENYLRPYAEIHDLPEARRIAERIAHILARAESATPAKHCEDCAPEFGCWDGGESCYKQPLQSSTPANQSPSIDAESLIAACVPGGSICDPQQVADAIREYLHQQEPCGGRCGDPECDLDTNGVTMRTPAQHADTVRIRNRIGNILVEETGNRCDNLAIVLVSYFSDHNDRPDDGEDDSETGWSTWAMQKTDVALDLIAASMKEARHD